ncbi:putative brefeldin A-inhibited guanine nucleotide-exchange protein 2 [Trypanosoma grayi]|uniref:putative brefeldin A-inhibited guanine nucleotide-exchange protein 2 n=1 Tax=Trypanosoma grayi TaxID=71804 RepID=UPI0004F4AB94|nr:putative brefeldin A-inhibited guanine nucleotide-exchange protein 2 [Trypanosoma grayi]KEG13338.1 putative brefeldin A-inhibited guanine nucleotide-exchange protein 2 [Trypanosoma grayi]
MQRTAPKLVADLENRTAFMVQLQALLLQAKHIVSGSQKGKLQDIQTGIEEWVKEVGNVGAPRPSICTPSPSTPVTLTTIQEEEQQKQQQQQQREPTEADGDNDTNNNTKSSSSTFQASISATQLPASSTPRGDEPFSFTVDMLRSMNGAGAPDPLNSVATLSTSFKSRNLEHLAEFLRMLCYGDLPESVKLRNVGRNAARLTIVRCFSIITNALQQVVWELYVDPVVAKEPCLDKNGECDAPPLLSPFVRLSHDIKVSTNAIMKCMELLTGHTEFSSTRFASQVCVDILKQLRLCVVVFQQRILREESRRLRVAEEAKTTTTATAAAGGDSSANAQKARQAAVRRVEELRRTMGPSLLISIEKLLGLVRPAVRYLVTVASLKETAGVQEERTLKNDVSAHLFGLAQWVSPNARPTQQQQQQQQRRTMPEDIRVTERETDAAKEHSSVDGAEQSVPLPECNTVVSPIPLWPHVAHVVLEMVVPAAFSPEYISCVAQHCGDQSDGQLVAVRILHDTVKKLASTDLEELRCMLGHATWRRRLMDGILNCLVSLQPAVLDAGLETLHYIVVGCPDCLGSEVGFLYTSGVFGLLESDNTPPAMRRALLRHVVGTFFKTACVPGQPSLLLRLYQQFDLNVRWHQLNVVQQAVATLSKAVRCAAPEGFADVVEKGSDDQETATFQRSLPFLALQGLSLAVELLTLHIPHDPDVVANITLPRLTNRDEKMEEQRVVDIINSSPLKGVRKLFNITDEEMNMDESGRAVENNWAHQYIPQPASPETELKVSRIAQFLRETPSLNPESVAEFLSYPAVLPLQVCRVFMEALPLAGMSLVDGLKKLFTLVQLPKEGQRIERLLEFFCSAYFKANSVDGVDIDTFPFESENACFIAGVAVLMLNTSLHNPHVSSAKMSVSTFQAQLRGCNEGKNFPEHFTKNIFDEINAHSLSSMKGFWSAGMSSGVRYASVPFPGKMDSIFFSNEERQELAFGVVRQRLVSETRELIYRCSKLESDSEENTSVFWCSVARDLFLSTWPSLCAVFGVAVHEVQVAEEALMLCVRGLRSSLLVAAAFGLHTECSVSQLALLRMASFEPMRTLCHTCVLEVAASPHSVHFTARCWTPVAELLVSTRKRQETLLVEAESVFGRVEEFTRESCGGCGVRDTDASPLVKKVVQEALRGMTAVVRDTSIDSATLAAALYVLRRAVGYSLISYEQQQGAVVTNLVNVRDFSAIIAPALVDVVEARSGKGDECLRVIVEFVVDVLATVWSSCVCGVEPPHMVSQAELAECHTFFQQCYERCATSTVVRMHVLQGVKELVSRTVHAAGATTTKPVGLRFQTFYNMTLIWQRLLQPLARALCDKDSVGTETCSLAVHVLRKLVVLCSGAGSTCVNIQLGKKVRNMVLLLLSSVAYIGGMCSDMDSALSCLTQFSTICTTVLNHDATIPYKGETALLDEVHESCFDAVAPKKLHLLLRRIIEAVQQKPDILVLNSLEQLCLLLRCQTQQTRTEVVTALRALVIQLEPSQLRHLAVHLSDTVLEASLGHATTDYKASAWDPSYVSFSLFDLRVPSTMRKCSITSFRVTLPLVMNLMSHELLSEAPREHLASVTTVVMRQCMVPLAVSPRATFQMRTTAVRALMQCAAVCTTRQSTSGDVQCLRAVADCVGLVLYASRVPVRLVVPADADHVGGCWVAEKKSAALEAYMQAAAGAVQALSLAEAYEVTGSRNSATLRVDVDVETLEEQEEFTRTTRGNWSVPRGDVATDEQLVEYCTLMAQLLSPLPKVLDAAPQRIPNEDGTEELRQQQPSCAVWVPPTAVHEVLAELVLEAAGIFFAILWRVNYFVEMENFMAKATQKGRDTPPLSKSSALLPHAAVRGALNAFLVLALQMDLSKLRNVIVEVLRATACVQTSTLSTREAQKINEGTVESAAMQRLSPQEHQHIRSCNVGMYQELSSVVSHWIKTTVQQTDAETSTLDGDRRAELQAVVGGADVFTGLVRLLTTTAGVVIVAIRDYLAWYITVHRHDVALVGEETTLDAAPLPPPRANGNEETDE